MKKKLYSFRDNERVFYKEEKTTKYVGNIKKNGKFWEGYLFANGINPRQDFKGKTKKSVLEQMELQINEI